MPKITFIDLQEDSLQQSTLSSAADTSLISPYLPKKKEFSLPKWFAPPFLSVIALKNLPVNILAFFIARASIMGEIAPFGLAFFAAALSAAPPKDKTVAVGVWVLAGVLVGGQYWEALIYALSMILYRQLAPKLIRYKKSIHTVPFFFLGSVFFCGTALMYWRDASLYGFFLTAADAVFCLALVYIFQ
jgi:stage II sporulation protein E